MKRLRDYMYLHFHGRKWNDKEIRVRNLRIRELLGEKIQEIRMRCFGHIKRREKNYDHATREERRNPATSK